MTNQQGEATPAPENPSSPTASLARLITGLLLESGSQLQGQLQALQTSRPADTTMDVQVVEVQPEESSPPPVDGQQMAYAALGLASNLAGGAWRIAKGAGNAAGNAAGWGLKPVRRVFGSRALNPLQSGFDRLVERGEASVNALASTGRAEADRSRQMARDLTQNVVGTTAAGFAENQGINLVIQGQIELLLKDMPAQARVDALVQALAANYLVYLQENPDRVGGLVQAAADQYIDHLSENPEQVQVLIQGQSVGLVEEVTDEIRDGLATADSMVEMLLRRVLRRTPRLLPPSPLDSPEIVARASQAALNKGDANEQG